MKYKPWMRNDIFKASNCHRAKSQNYIDAL